MDRERRDAARRRWGLALGLVNAALFAVLSARPLHDNDFFWHLALGRAVLDERRRVVTDTLSLLDFQKTVVAGSWLWDAPLYAVSSRFGYVGVSAVVIACAACVGAALVALVETWRETRPSALVSAAVTFTVGPLVAMRITERPETGAILCWLLGLMLARSLSRVLSVQGAAVRAAALLVLVAAWSQIHLSFIGFLIVTVILVGPHTLDVRSNVVHRVRAAAVVLAFGALLLTPIPIFSTSGFFTNPVTPYIAEHIAEWQPLTWEMVNPFDPVSVPGSLFGLVAVVALVGAARLRQRALLEIALAAFGVVLVWKGRRGVTPAAMLGTPLLVATLEDAIGAMGSRRAVMGRVAAALVGLYAMVRITSWLGVQEGPILGGMGLRSGAFPTAAARFFREERGAHRALTTYRSGPILGFETAGRVRGFVDSRTPLSFSSHDLAAARLVWSNPRAIGAAVERYRFDVAVVDRDLPVCAALQSLADWSVVLVEPRFTTFARNDASPPIESPPLRRLAPCGARVIDERACRAPLAELDAEIERAAQMVPTPFANYLRAERMLRCASGGMDGDAIAERIPPRADSGAFLPERDALEAWLLALAGRYESSLDLLRPHVEAHRTWLLADALTPLLRGEAAAPGLRTLLERAVDLEGDALDEGVVVALSLTCARLGDAECAATAAARVAPLGRSDVGPALCFLRERANTPESRADAERWLDGLRKRAPGHPALACGGPAR